MDFVVNNGKERILDYPFTPRALWEMWVYNIFGRLLKTPAKDQHSHRNVLEVT